MLLFQIHIERTRDLMSTEFAALVGESYERAYTDMVRGVGAEAGCQGKVQGGMHRHCRRGERG